MFCTVDFNRFKVSPGLFILLLFGFFWLPFDFLMTGFSPYYYDRQRIIVIVMSMFLVFFSPLNPISLSALFLFFLSIGSFSSLLSEHPLYGFLEVLSFILVYFIVVGRGFWCQREAFFYKKMLSCAGVVFSILYMVIFYVLLLLTLSLLSMDEYLSLDVVPLFPFVENCRYINSVQALLVFFPWLILRYAKVGRVFVFFAILSTSLNLSALFLGGARSAIVSVFLGFVFLIFNSKMTKRVVFYGVLSFVFGVSIYLLTKYGVDIFYNKGFSGDVLNRVGGMRHGIPGAEVVTSGRWGLWGLSIESIIEFPWLGVGPMHFATFATIAAHPHNLFLTIAVEWGLPAFILFLYLFYCCLISWYRQGNSVGFALIVVAVCDSLFSGNFVYPLSQLYILLVVLIFKPPSLTGKYITLSKIGAKAISFCLVISLIIMSAFTFKLSQLSSNFMLPRYWLHGQF